jgi:hypothetical protein
MDFKGRGYEGVDWIHLAQDKALLVNTAMNLTVIERVSMSESSVNFF